MAVPTVQSHVVLLINIPTLLKNRLFILVILSHAVLNRVLLSRAVLNHIVLANRILGHAFLCWSLCQRPCPFLANQMVKCLAYASNFMPRPFLKITIR
jgi:hypothetical protein